MFRLVRRSLVSCTWPRAARSSSTHSLSALMYAILEGSPNPHRGTGALLVGSRDLRTGDSVRWLSTGSTPESKGPTTTASGKEGGGEANSAHESSEDSPFDDSETSFGHGKADNMFEDPKGRILDAALAHIGTHGFTDVAIAAGSRDCGFHAVSAGMFSRGAIELVEHLMDNALQEVKALQNKDGHRHRQPNFGQGEAVVDSLRDGIRVRLMVITPYISHWPKNVVNTTSALAVLADELAFLSGDRSTDLEWYSKRALIAGIYVSTEMFMITDTSEGFTDTWAFLDRRLEDYNTLVTTPQNAGDVVLGVTTTATALGSAVVSLAGPFLQQATRQVPGAQTVSYSAPMAAALVSSVLSYLASHIPHDGSKKEQETSTSHRDPPETFQGAPEADPLAHGGVRGTTNLSSLRHQLDKEEKAFDPDGSEWGKPTK